MWIYEYLYFSFGSCSFQVCLAREMVVGYEKQLTLKGNWTTLCCIYLGRAVEKLDYTSFPTDTVAEHNWIAGGKRSKNKADLNLGYLERNAQSFKAVCDSFILILSGTPVNENSFFLKLRSPSVCQERIAQLLCTSSASILLTRAGVSDVSSGWYHTIWHVASFSRTSEVPDSHLNVTNYFLSKMWSLCEISLLLFSSHGMKYDAHYFWLHHWSRAHVLGCFLFAPFRVDGCLKVFG